MWKTGKATRTGRKERALLKRLRVISKSNEIKMPRKKLIAANWKMNKTIKEAVSFIKEFKSLVEKNNKDIVIAPPFTALIEAKKNLDGTKIKLGAQNMHFEEKGAFTGEISASMLRDAGCEYVILGHSERRQHFSETDDLINKKIKTALKVKLKVILCIGETLEQRENNETKAIIRFQLENCLRNINNDVHEKQGFSGRRKKIVFSSEMQNIVVAYEPVWAIGTGKTATPEQAEEVHKFIRELLKKLYNEKISNEIRILYGGSVNPGNAKELLAMNNIDGALVGGASLEPESFAEICNA